MYLLFDLGGTKTRCAVSKDGKSFEDVHIYKTPHEYKEGLELFTSIKAELIGDKTLKAVIGGVAASFDRKGEELVGGGRQIHNWLNKPIKKDLAKIFGAPIHIFNDTMMGGLAQSHFGPAQGKEISVYVTVSTGVGGARIVEGKIDTHAHGFEPGWQIIDAGNMLCNGWSEKGYLIDYIGGMGIEKNMGSKPEEIFDEAFWRSRAEFLAYGLHNIAVMWSPDIITIGGSIAKSIPFDEIEKYYYENIKKVFPKEHPLIAPAQFGDEMGLWGALGYIKMYKV